MKAHSDDSAVRAEAPALAQTLPAILLEARRLAAAFPGAHGRRRAGPGEAFWQFRDHRPEDGARLVDWRRSARGERLYVREREREAAQSALFWVDPDPGFAWAAAPDRPTKRRRALTICLALAMAVARAGERIGALGGPPPRRGPQAAEMVGLDLTGEAAPAPQPPRARAALIYASDFYAPLELWRARLQAAAATGAHGALLMVSDPAEEDFPFAGRTEFARPGGADRVLIGRPERIADEYRLRLADHRTRLRALASGLGFALIAHRVDNAPAPALAQLAQAVERAR